MINTLHKDKVQLYKYTRKDMVLVSSSPYPGVVLCQTLPVVSVTDSFVTTQAPPFSSPQNDPTPSSSPPLPAPSPQLAPPPAQCTCRTEVSPQVHLSPAIFFLTWSMHHMHLHLSVSAVTTKVSPFLICSTPDSPVSSDALAPVL